MAQRQFVVTHKNGVEYKTPLNIGLDPDKFVMVYNRYIDNVAETPTFIINSPIDNRRVQPDVYTTNLKRSTVAALITNTLDEVMGLDTDGLLKWIGFVNVEFASVMVNPAINVPAIGDLSKLQINDGSTKKKIEFLSPDMNSLLGIPIVNQLIIQVVIPTDNYVMSGMADAGGSYDCAMNWGDGIEENASTPAELDHTYALAGTYTIKIEGLFTQFQDIVGATLFKNVLTGITQFGLSGLDTLDNAFNGCASIVSSIPEIWEVLPSIPHSNTFTGCTSATNYADIPNDWKGL